MWRKVISATGTLANFKEEIGLALCSYWKQIPTRGKIGSTPQNFERAPAVNLKQLPQRIRDLTLIIICQKLREREVGAKCRTVY